MPRLCVLLPGYKCLLLAAPGADTVVPPAIAISQVGIFLVVVRFALAIAVP
jgi:hypothetical protein